MGSSVIDRYDRIADGYARCWAPVLLPGGVRLLGRLETEDRRLAAGTSRAVLDVGCGTGSQLLDAAQRWARAQLTGLDASAGMLGVTRRALDALPSEVRGRVSLVQGDAADLPFPDASFDLVMSCFVVQLVTDRAAVLREMRRVLRPDGTVAVAGWLEERETELFEPEDAFELALVETGVERPPADEQRAGDFTSVRSAAGELRRAGFRRVAGRGDELHFDWTPQTYADYKASSREALLIEALPPDVRSALLASFRRRLDVLAQKRPEAFRMRLPMVTLLARA